MLLQQVFRSVHHLHSNQFEAFGFKPLDDVWKCKKDHEIYEIQIGLILWFTSDESTVDCVGL